MNASWRLYYACLDDLTKDEGWRNRPYTCPAGKLTIGIGHNLDANGISDSVVLQIFREDYEACIKALYSIFGEKFFERLPIQKQKALINMIFNLGETKFRQFKATIAAIKNEDWNKAAQQALASKWGRIDVPKRAARVAEALRE